MAKSAGILLFRRHRPDRVEVFLVHPGGPFWRNKDEGAWCIPKGEYDGDEPPFDAARREWTEETGLPVPEGEFIPLDEIRQAGGKRVTIWAIEGDADADAVKSITFNLEFPPRSGKFRDFPEVDRAAWFPIDLADIKILPSQQPLLQQLRQRLKLT